jgi:hypothetical protein
LALAPVQRRSQAGDGGRGRQGRPAGDRIWSAAAADGGIWQGWAMGMCQQGLAVAAGSTALCPDLALLLLSPSLLLRLRRGASSGRRGSWGVGEAMGKVAARRVAGCS